MRELRERVGTAALATIWPSVTIESIPSPLPIVRPFPVPTIIGFHPNRSGVLK
jgi:hypothetical protein